MKKTLFLLTLIASAILIVGCQSDQYERISEDELRNKIAGGWAGKMIGVSYGAPTEFEYNGIINEDPINWNPASLRKSTGQDDLYVQMSFMMTMDEFGMDAPVEKFGEAFANAGYMLWHANRGARMNIWNGILPPESGHPDYNLHADDIDFQIEADYIGLMSPGMPQTSNMICDKIGHIMNYGDGVYGGMFVSALYAAAYFENDIKKVLSTAMKSLPEESQYHKILSDVIDGYQRNPDDWKKTWKEIYDTWGEGDICCALSEFNIDAKLNGAFIAMGLLYGEGDFKKTLEISTRCGADSDCNPSNCGGVMGIIMGYDKIPSEWTGYIDEIADSLFIYTDYSFNIAVDRTLHYAKQLIVENGGKIEDGMLYIKKQEAVPAKLEVSFPGIVPKEKVTIDDEEYWEWKGDWKTVQQPNQWEYEEKQKQAEQAGAEAVFKFNGTGAVLMGRFDMDCGQVDIFVDGEFYRSKDLFYKMMDWGAGDGWLNGAHLAHVMNLDSGDHEIRLVINGKKNEKSTGTKLKVARAIIYDSEPEKIRVLLDTDANNELDDQHAISYMLFNGDSFDVEGITVNKTSNGGDVSKHYEEAERVVKLCGLQGTIDIYTGANGSFKEIKDHMDEPDFDGMEAVNFIIERAHANSDRKLVLLPVGKLTNIALALKKDPSIAPKVRIVWLGSNYPDPGEYNQVNDISAMQYVLDAEVDLEIVMVRYDKPSGTDAVRALLSEIEEVMPGKGPTISTPVTGRHGNEFTSFGDYSISLFRNIEEYHGDPPSRALFDMAAVAIVKNPSWAVKSRIPSPEYLDGTWIERPGNPHEITIWENFDKKSILDDFYASMEDYVLVNSLHGQKISKEEYKDKLKGFWLGGCIANWTGLPTENRRTDFPFFTDDDFGPGKYDYILDEDPWGADDDTDIEYVYQHAIETNDQYKLTGEQISEAWQNHIGLPKLWVSNLSALGQMQNGAIPPATSLPENNPMWDMIDAQLTTEIFGALAPGRPDVALDIAHLPIRTTAYLHSEWASEFYVIMHSLVAAVDQSLCLKDQVTWLADQARKRIPDWSYIADMYDFVKAAYEANPDKDNWEKTRNQVAQRYQQSVTAGYLYKYPWDSGINFAASMVSLFYGEGDYKKTIRIGCMCGWDSDNPTSTWGGLLGLLYGHERLQSHFNKTDFSDAYYIERSRYNMPIPLDNFNDMAERGLDIIDDIVLGAMGGSIEGDNWIIPEMKSDIIAAAVPKTNVPWLTIEDNDPRWIFTGFESHKNNWNASGATLAFGYENCKAEITFIGKAVQYYAYRSPKGGKVTIALDGVSYGEFSLENHNTHGQHYVKIFEKLGLKSGSHTLIIQGDEDATEKTIDMLSVVE